MKAPLYSKEGKKKSEVVLNPKVFGVRVTTEFSDWATNCPEYKVTAVQVRRTNHLSQWQEEDRQHSIDTRRIELPTAAE